MNEQIVLYIQQLAEQADNLTIEHFGTALNLPDPKEWQRIRDSIFAKMIVNECSGIAMSNHTSGSFKSSYDLNEYDIGCYDTASLISGNIKFRFGIN